MQSGLQRGTVGVVLLRRGVERLGRVLQLRTDLARQEELQGHVDFKSVEVFYTSYSVPKSLPHL